MHTLLRCDGRKEHAPYVVGNNDSFGPATRRTREERASSLASPRNGDEPNSVAPVCHSTVAWRAHPFLPDIAGEHHASCTVSCVMHDAYWPFVCSCDGKEGYLFLVVKNVLGDRGQHESFSMIWCYVLSGIYDQKCFLSRALPENIVPKY